MMKARITALFVSLLPFSIYCSDMGWKTFFHQQGRYEFKYPANASIEQPNNKDFVYIVFSTATTPHKKILFEVRGFFYEKSFDAEVQKSAKLSCDADGPDGTSYCLPEDIKITKFQVDKFKGCKVERTATS